MKEINYQIYSDGGARGNPGPAGIGFVIKKDGKIIKQIGRFIGVSTNNQAEYQALIFGLSELQNLITARESISANISIFLDSELIVRQLSGVYQVRDKKLKPLYQKARQIIDQLPKVEVNHIPRNLNYEADSLVNQAIDAKDL